MSPYQHGEVFVTDDGAETDLDLGHYERFIDENLSQLEQRHDRPDLPGRDRQGAPRRLPRRHRPGHPAHHQRDQGADPARGPRRASRRGDRRGRRDRRRHREPAVPRGDPPDAQGRRPGQRPVRPRHAAARARRDRRAQDEADPALGQGAARDRHPARRDRPALRPPGQRRDPREDRPVHRRRRPRRSSRPRRPTRSTRSRSCSRRPASATWSSASSGLADVAGPPDLAAWRALVERIKAPKPTLEIALVGKYIELPDAYMSRDRGAPPRGLGARRRRPVRWVDSETLTPENTARAARRRRRHPRAGRVRPPRDRGQGPRRPLRPRPRGPVPRACASASSAPSSSSPARSIGDADANSTEFDLFTENPVIDFMPDQREHRGQGRDDAPGALPGPADARLEGRRGLRPGGHLRAPPPPLRGQQPLPPDPRGGRAWSCPASRPTAGSSRSSSCATIPGSWPASSIPSSRAGPSGRTRCSTGSSPARSPSQTGASRASTPARPRSRSMAPAAAPAPTITVAIEPTVADAAPSGQG